MIVQAVMVLVGKKAMGLVQKDEEILSAKDKTDRLNTYFIRHAYGSKEIGYLVSPVTGGGVPCSRIEKIFLAAKLKGKSRPKELAEFAWQIVSSQNQRIIKDGKEINNSKDSIEYLTNEAKDFDAKQVPVLKALGIL